MVRLASGGIDFTSHFLGYEAELLALSVAGSHGFAEVGKVVGEALLFLVDVQLLDVVYQFLFQTVLVIIHADGLFECSGNFFTDFGHTFHFVRFDILHQCFDVVQLFVEFLFKGGSFLDAEVGDLVNGFVDGLAYDGPFLVAQFLDVDFGQYVRHAKQGGKEVGRHRNVRSGSNILELFVVIAHQRSIDRSCHFGSFLLNP